MNFKRAVREALLLFPSELVISTPSNETKDGARSANLAKAWGRAEDSVSAASVWQQLAVWSVGCALHQLVKEAGFQGHQLAHKKNIDLQYVEFKFAESLLTPNTWFPGEIKRAYRRDRYKRGLPEFTQNNKNI